MTKLREAWEHRYAAGRDSGAGSRGSNAQRKATYVNALIVSEQIQSVVDHGCGDGGQLELLDVPDYLGIDISATAIARCIQKHPGKQFLVYDPRTKVAIGTRAELALSMDVIFHLVDDADFRSYILRLFRSATRYVCIYSTDFDEERRMHVRHRNWTPYISQHFPDWELMERHSVTQRESFFLYRRR